MASDYPPPCGEVVVRHFGSDPLGPGFSGLFGLLYSVAAALGVYDTTALATASSILPLHPLQEKSFWIIWMWWSSHASLFRLRDNEDPQGYQVWYVDGHPHILKLKSFYSLKISELLRLEFNEPTFSTMSKPSKYLILTRGSAAVMSACQAIALECCQSNREVVLDESGSDITLSTWNGCSGVRSLLWDACVLPGADPRCVVSPSVTPCPWLNIDSRMPYFLWDKINRRTVKVEQLSENPAYTTISHTWGRWEKRVGNEVIKTHVDGLEAWEVPENTIFDVTQLPLILSRVPTSTRFVWFDLLCIPQDRSERAREEIAKQAVIFRKAKYGLVWLNDIHSWDGIKSAVTWMSLIFLEMSEDQAREAQSRSHPISNAASSTGLFARKDINNAQIVRDDLRPSGWFTSLWTLQEVCMRPDMLLCNSNWELLSVGTMNVPLPINTLIALTGECTRILDRRAPVVALDGSLTIFKESTSNLLPAPFDVTMSTGTPANVLQSLCDRKEYNMGFNELFELFDRTGLQNIVSMERRHVMNFASLRFCKKSRAEAIMSVLGATEWYKTSSQDVKCAEDDLVLSQYPLSFVREVAAILGAFYYDFLSVSSKDIKEIMKLPLGAYRGSLMPFNVASDHTKTSLITDHKVPSYPSHVQGSEIGHESVQSWRITVEGSVHMHKVGLVASSHDVEETPQINLAGSVWLSHDKEAYKRWDFGEQFRMEHYTADSQRCICVELRTFLRRYHVEEGANYAVELTTSYEAKRGILLKEVPGHPGILFKIGNFAISHNGLRVQKLVWDRKIKIDAPVESVNVDWYVL